MKGRRRSSSGRQRRDEDRLVVHDVIEQGARQRRAAGPMHGPRLTGRGRLTLVALGLASLALVGFAAQGLAPRIDLGIAAVSAPAPQLPARPAALAVPREILAHVPAFDPEEVARSVEAGEGLSEVLRITGPDGTRSLQVEYAFDPELMRRVNRVLRRDRALRAHVVAMDVESGRLLAYTSSDPEAFPPTRAYPAASLVKIVTAAGAIDHAPERARGTCRFRGSPYRLTRSRLNPPRAGNEASLERALATSNNQCFAQLAVHALGAERMLSSIRRFGWLDAPAPGHEAGAASAGEDDYALGKLGCGLAGCRITPLHAVQLAASLAHGELVVPWWIERVIDDAGRERRLPEHAPSRRAMSPALASELRAMLVKTTTHGTARRGFRTRRGHLKLGDVRVAGKTGNISEHDGTVPSGRYEWFTGVAPADDPRIAVAVLQLQGGLWWSTSSTVAADVFKEIFCERGRCRSELASRYLEDSRAREALGPVAFSHLR